MSHYLNKGCRQAGRACEVGRKSSARTRRIQGHFGLVGGAGDGLAQAVQGRCHGCRTGRLHTGSTRLFGLEASGLLETPFLNHL